MKPRTQEFVRERIERRAKKQGLPFKNTGFWSDAPLTLKRMLPASVVSPLVFTMSERGEAAIIGTDEVIVISKQGTVRVPSHRIEHITSPCTRLGKEKLEYDALELVVTDGGRLLVPTETGKACFAIWNILLQLVRIGRKGQAGTTP